MLIETAIADSYSIPWEFVSDPHKHGLVNDLRTYQQNPRYTTLGASRYTDDTLRAIILARVVLSGDVTNAQAYITEMQKIYESDQRDGWSHRFQQYLQDNRRKSARDFMAGLKRGNTNGSLMGTPVLGFIPEEQIMLVAAGVQALATHAATTIPYAQMMAAASHWFIHRGGDRAGLLAYMEEITGFEVPIVRSDNPKDMTARGTVGAVMSLLLDPQNTSLMELLHTAVRLGGDTDSIAALTIAIASCSNEYKADLSEELFLGLEGGDPQVRINLDLLEQELRKL